MLFFYLILSLYGSSSISLQPLTVSSDKPLESSIKLSSDKSSDLLVSIKSNPKQFMEEAQQLDPTAIRNIIALLETLRGESESRENLLKSELNDAQNELNDANTDVADAEDVLEVADKAVTDGKQALASAEQDQAAAVSDLDSKKEVHKAKQTIKDTKQQNHDDEVPSLDNDQQVLTDVISMLEDLHGKHSEKWNLAMNIHPSDGHDFGYGAPEWNSGTSVGNKNTAFTADFLDSEVWASLASSIAIVRHQDGACEAVKVWKLLETKSLLDYFKNVKRHKASSGGPVYESIDNSMVGKDTDPIFGVNGDLALNWWYSNNGVRIALDGGHLSAVNVNDDGTHGLGNEYGANTEGFGRSDSWWHDVGNIQGDCDGGSCIVQGTDHGTALHDAPMFGQYAIFVSELEESKFDCDANAHLSNIAD